MNDLRPTKGGKARRVPISGPLRASLEALDRCGEYVVCRTDGKPLSARGFDKRIYRVQARAGLPRKGSHILRHSFCSHLAMRGVHPRKIQ